MRAKSTPLTVVPPTGRGVRARHPARADGDPGRRLEDDLAPRRILEISRSGLFKALYPDRTLWVRWGPPLTAAEPHEPEALGVRALTTILKSIHHRAYDLVVLPAIHPEHHIDEAPHKMIAKNVLQATARSPMVVSGIDHLLGPSRYIIVDINDSRSLCATTLRLFPRHSGYFKRELALDLEQDPRFAGHLYPLPLFVPSESRMPAPQPKSVDVFFAGALCNPVRRAAVAAARSLAKRGLRVVLPESPLPYHQFLTSLASSWLALSPEGYGWDCYRHYEACLAGSVPVINRSDYRRHLYLQDGVHCFYYDPGRGSLSEFLRASLADTDRLRRMAEVGRQHVLAHHTRASVARYMLEKLAGDPPPGRRTRMVAPHH